MQATHNLLVTAPASASRRQLLLAATVLNTPGVLTACSSSDTVQTSAGALRRTWSPGGDGANLPLIDLVRHATLAPSSHNTQCWRFQIADKSISISPDFTRRCPAVDPDDHHLFVSLGCAAENLVHSALAAGLQADARFNPAGDGIIEVNLEATNRRVTPLFLAIAARQCTRGDYDGQPISTAELRQLEKAGTGDGVSVRLLTARPVIESLLAYVVAGDTAQMNDPAFMAELNATSGPGGAYLRALEDTQCNTQEKRH